MNTDKTTPQALSPTILSFAKDPPNLCSFAGLACSLSAIYFCISGIYSAAMIGMVWAVAFDWADGLIARRMKGRTGDDRAFGGHLDGLIDIVSYGVTPAILLLSYGKFEPQFLVGALLMLIAGALRLSHFSTFGLVNGTHYKGLALDNNNLIIVLVFLLEDAYSGETFSYILYACGVGLAALNVSKLEIRKLSGNPVNVYILAFYTLAMTAIYAAKLL